MSEETGQTTHSEFDAEDSDTNLTDIMFTKLGLPKVKGLELANCLLQTEILTALKNAGILSEAQINEMLNRVSAQIAATDDYIKNSYGVENEQHKSDVKKLKAAATDYVEQIRQALITESGKR